jgi:hypothetical protein
LRRSPSTAWRALSVRAASAFCAADWRAAAVSASRSPQRGLAARRLVGQMLTVGFQLLLFHRALNGFAIDFQATGFAGGLQILLAGFVAAIIDQEFLLAIEEFLIPALARCRLQALALVLHRRGPAQALLPRGILPGIGRQRRERHGEQQAQEGSHW